MTTSPSAASSFATVLTRSIAGRQFGEATTLATSDGQTLLPGPRFAVSERIVERMRASNAASVGSSHHGSPRSPSACLASFTLARACWTRSGSSRLRRISRLAAINSVTSSALSRSGIDRSVARHLRPFTTMWRPSALSIKLGLFRPRGSLATLKLYPLRAPRNLAPARLSHCQVVEHTFMV